MRTVPTGDLFDPGFLVYQRRLLTRLLFLRRRAVLEGNKGKGESTRFFKYYGLRRSYLALTPAT